MGNLDLGIAGAGVATTRATSDTDTCGEGVELETKVHPKVRNHGEGPY